MTDVPATKVLQAGLWEETALELGISEDYLGTELKIKKKKMRTLIKPKYFRGGEVFKCSGKLNPMFNQY